MGRDGEVRLAQELGGCSGLTDCEGEMGLVRSGCGVRDDGSQAGEEERHDSGKGVVLPDIERGGRGITIGDDVGGSEVRGMKTSAIGHAKWCNLTPRLLVRVSGR
jgi:hypothetical protein